MVSEADINKHLDANFLAEAEIDDDCFANHESNKDQISQAYYSVPPNKDSNEGLIENFNIVEMIKKNSAIKNLEFLHSNRFEIKNFIKDFIINKQNQQCIDDDYESGYKKILSSSNAKRSEEDPVKLNYSNATKLLIKIIVICSLLGICLIIYIALLLDNSSQISNLMTSYFVLLKSIKSRLILTLNLFNSFNEYVINPNQRIDSIFEDYLIQVEANEELLTENIYENIYSDFGSIESINFSPICSYLISNFENSTSFYDTNYNSYIYYDNNSTAPLAILLCQGKSKYNPIISKSLSEIFSYIINILKYQKDQFGKDFNDNKQPTIMYRKSEEVQVLRILLQYYARNMVMMMNQYINMDLEKSLSYDSNQLIIKRAFLMLIILVICSVYYKFFRVKMNMLSVIDEMYISIIPDEAISEEIHSKVEKKKSSNEKNRKTSKKIMVDETEVISTS